MNTQQQPRKILRWIKASERLPEVKKTVFFKYQFPDYPPELISGQLIDYNNGHKLFSFGGLTYGKFEFIEWLEETEDLSASASPVIEGVEINITDPETTDEKTYRKLSEWYLKQLRECQDELRRLKAPPVIEIGEKVQRIRKMAETYADPKFAHDSFRWSHMVRIYMDAIKEWELATLRQKELDNGDKPPYSAPTSASHPAPIDAEYKPQTNHNHENYRFTPGPWSAGGNKPYKGNEAQIFDNSTPEKIIAYLGGNIDHNRPSLHESVANAHLIAASPCLFNSLVGLVEFNKLNHLCDEQAHDGEEHFDTWQSSKLRELFESATSAINKALNK